MLPTLHTSQVSLNYTQFLSDVSAHKVKTITLSSTGPASGTLANGSTYETVIPGQAASQLLDQLQKAKVEITASTPGPSSGRGARLPPGRVRRHPRRARGPGPP